MLKRIGQLILVLALLLAALFIGARFADGPLALVPGGPLKAGTNAEFPQSWDFARDVQEIELETGGRSRTVWVAVVNGEGYIPASLSFPPFKTWHMEVLEEPAAKIRIDEKIYRVELEQIAPDSAEFATVGAVFTQKYPSPPPGNPTDGPGVMIFRLAEPN